MFRETIIVFLVTADKGGQQILKKKTIENESVPKEDLIKTVVKDKAVPKPKEKELVVKTPPKKVVEKKKPALAPTLIAAPVSQRKSSRNSLANESVKMSDSEDETLDIKMLKVVEKRKATKKLEKEKEKPSLASIRKSKLDKVKAQSMSQLVRFTKKKFLNVRKSTEACIQELVASTLERLNKQEEEDADEIDLDLIDEPIIQTKTFEKEKMPTEKKKTEPKKTVVRPSKDVVAKKFVPPTSNEKFYAKKTAAIYPPSPAKLKKLGIGKELKKLQSELKKPAEEKKSSQNLVVINSPNQELVLFPSAASSSNYVVCRKEAAGGVQFMMVPADKGVLPVAPTLQPETKKKALESEPKKIKACSSTQILCKYSW